MKKVINYGLCHLLVSWYSEPSQPQRIMSGLKTNSNLFPSYSVYKSLNHESLLLLNNDCVKIFHKETNATQHTSYFTELISFGKSKLGSQFRNANPETQ